jgi:hypothetical protein
MNPRRMTGNSAAIFGPVPSLLSPFPVRGTRGNAAGKQRSAAGDRETMPGTHGGPRGDGPGRPSPPGTGGERSSQSQNSSKSDPARESSVSARMHGHGRTGRPAPAVHTLRAPRQCNQRTHTRYACKALQETRVADRSSQRSASSTPRSPRIMFRISDSNSHDLFTWPRKASRASTLAGDAAISCLRVL